MTGQCPAEPRSRRRCPDWAKRMKDLTVTLILWFYYTAGFAALFAPFYLWAWGFVKDRQAAFQRLNCLFYRGFFRLLRWIVPRQKWRIADSVRRIRSSVVVSNHVSYLDSILLISLYEKHTTIAKAGLFDILFFGRMLALSGYIPSSGQGRYANLMLNCLETLPDRLADGGNLIVFPEGTRSRSGRVGQLNKGVFKIAQRCRAPIKVVAIRNTEKLFEPGRFLFHTCAENTIHVELLADIRPDYESEAFSIQKLAAEIRSLLEASAWSASRGRAGADTVLEEK